MKILKPLLLLALSFFWAGPASIAWAQGLPGSAPATTSPSQPGFQIQPGYPYGYFPPSYGPDTVAWDNALCLMPLSFLGLGMELSFEHYRPEKLRSTRFNAGLFTAANPYFYDGYKDYLGFRVEVQERFHFLKSKYQAYGIYVAPYAQFKFISLSHKDFYYSYYSSSYTYQKVRSTAIGLGIIFGYEKRYSTRLLVDYYVGGGYIIPTNASTSSRVSVTFVNPYQSGVAIHAGIGIGIINKRASKQ
jgi:hypothetical protein